MSYNPTYQELKDVWYGPNGYYRTGKISGVNNKALDSALHKADVPLTFSGSTSWFDPVYSGELWLNALSRSTKAFKAMPKTTYQQKGDSFQFIGTDSHTGLSNILEGGALFTDTSVPALTDWNNLYPAVLKVTWTDTEVAAAMSAIQKSRPTMNSEQIKKYMERKFLDALDMQLCGTYVDFAAGGDGTNQGGYGVDAPATASSTAQFESLDRLLSDYTESGAGTTYVHAATDGDVYLSEDNAGSSTDARIDRSADTTDLYGAQVRLPTNGTAAAGEAYELFGELDDLAAKALVYDQSETPNYALFMSPKAYNKLKSESDAKERFIAPSEYTASLNGVTNTPGALGGKMQLGGLRLADVSMPIFTLPYLMGTAKSSWLWKSAKHTGGSCGNIYGVNMNAIEFRTLIPITYRTWPSTTALENMHIIYMAGCFFNTQWRSHFALKYIAT